MKKRGQFNFVWLFALLVGGAILFLAIFGALRTADTERFKTDTEIAKEISIITNPLQAGFSEGSFGKIEFISETRVNNVCLTQERDFGKNEISVSTRSDIGEEWNTPGGATSVHNKYIFSGTRNTGEIYYVFSKSFDLPYKVSDLIFLTTANYCFVNAPDEISEELTGLRIPNMQISPDCTLSQPVRVCFGRAGENCEINVFGDLKSGVVEKYGVSMSYTGNLLYGAIFSDKEIYDCNVQRLMHRTSRIAEEFSEKTHLLNSRDCGTNLKPHLDFWKSATINADSDDLARLSSEAEGIQREHDRELCGIW